MEYNIVTVIPARAGSRRLPRKNTVECMLNGRPMIEYTLEAVAGSVAGSGPVVVSTEHEPTLNYVQDRGLFARRRPADLCGPDVRPADVIIDAVEWLKDFGVVCDTVVLAQITSPLRTSADIDAALSMYYQTESTRLISVSEAHQQPFDMLDTHGRWVGVPREAYLFVNGAIYISEYNELKRCKSFWEPDGRSAMYLMPKWRSIDVDDPEDLEMAEKIMKGEAGNG